MPKIYTILFWFSAVLSLVAVVVLFVFGLNLSVDFTGGSVLEIQFLNEQPLQSEIYNSLTELDFLTTISIQLTEGGSIIRLKELTENQHQEVSGVLERNFGEIEEKRFDSIGPTIGRELKSKSIRALIILFIAITIYIAIAFWKLSSVLSPWAMGIAAFIALFHDVLITAGIFAVLGKTMGVEITAVFVAAALTILGYSVSDSVIIFDRIRENVLRDGGGNFGGLVHKSLMQTLSRSINTSLTTSLSLFAIFLFGGVSIKMFSLALIIGVILGTYSSFIIVSPILVYLSRPRR